MNRRGFMATAGAFAGLGLLPSWRAFKQRKQIDLTPFCDEDCYGRFAIDKPFAQDGMVYATDARIMCRTTLADAPELSEGARLPGASTLPWWKETDLQWKPWPKLALFADADSYGDICPKCWGKGVFGNIRECVECRGLGEIIDKYDWSHGCKACRESGYTGDVRCDYCGGSGSTERPALQRVGSLVVAGHYDARVRGLGEVEYAICRYEVIPTKLVKFRGDGFEGLLLPMIGRGAA